MIKGCEVMNVQQIIDMIQMKYPHSYDSSQIITMLNDIQKRIFRTLYKPETAITYDILADNPFYPIDFPPESIIDVVVNGEEYPRQNIKYAAYSRYFYITEDNCIGIYPTPTEDISCGMTVFYYKEPNNMTSVNDTPDLEPAWHMLLVNHVCRELAQIARESDMVNTFVREINELEGQYRISNRSIPHQILDVYGIGRGV